MSWWSSVVDGVSSFGSGVKNTAKWLWNNASLSKITVGAVTYTANTTFQLLEQGLALRKAVPTLINNPEARKVVNGMAYIVVNDVLPLLALNYANNTVQGYFREGHQDDPWLAPYTAFLSALTLVNYGVKAYTMRQGAQSFVRITILDAVGPAAFNSNKIEHPPSLCSDLDCNYKRKLKGMGREPLILMANDALTSAISYIPYVGMPASQVLRVYFNGRYITRLATPERCERHKAMMQESVLALGLGFEASSMLMDYLLEATTGIPPFLYHRTMRHLLLLMHVNLAAHMTIPLVEDKDATLPADPLNIYERICRFIADVIFSGLVKRVPIDFKPEKGAPPLIPLSPTLQLGTRVLNSDLERENKDIPGWIKRVTSEASQWVLPPIFQGSDGLINDPIVNMYWPKIRQGGISAVEFVQSVGKTKTVATLAWAPKSVATALNIKFGIPKKLTRIVLMLTQEKDFWDFAEAMKRWFERHNIKCDVALVAENNVLILHGERPLIAVPEQIDNTPHVDVEDVITRRTASNDNGVISVAQILSERRSKPIIEELPDDDSESSAEQLIPRRKPSPVIVLPSHSTESLFTTRKRGGAAVKKDLVIVGELSLGGGPG
jgi:hypothetical protein